MSFSTVPTDTALTDDFTQPCRRGKVIDSVSSTEQRRQGVDAEKRLSIDNGALRIQPLVTPGWGRAGIAYGPYKRQAGLALSVFMLNGHNTSEGNSIEETLKGRIFRWVRGSEANSIGNRLLRWSLSPLHRPQGSQFYRWIRNHKGRFKQGYIKDNLALGWFPEAVPDDPTSVGQAIVIRANGPENGELWTRQGNRLTPVFKGLQNIQTYYLVILRENGAAYYAASVPNAYGLSAFPYMRLLGIDTQAASTQAASSDTVHAGLYQSALGQVGFRVDTRVYGVQARVLPELTAWYGTAQMADRLIGEGALENAQTEQGGCWQVVEGHLQKTERGLAAENLNNSLALLDMAAPAGAVHLLAMGGEMTPNCALFWRVQNTENMWGLFFEQSQCTLKIKQNAQWSVVAVESTHSLSPQTCSAIQILDDGTTFSLYLDSELLFGQWFADARLEENTGIGLAIFSGCDVRLQQIEAHPRDITIPPALISGTPWQMSGSQVVITENFAGPARDLDGRPIESDVKGYADCWCKVLGKGKIALTGAGTARVEASAQQPNPGRLAYTVNWTNPEQADLSVDIVPPGTERRQGEKGRGGLIFWQDPDHYITVSHWLDDTYGGASLSAFFHIDGFEEIYDAVWTNVGTRVVWGKRHRLRVVFNGMNFLAYIDGEPVLYRALSDVYPQVKSLKIRRVGIVANWEWGNDTGSMFSRFIGKA